MNVFVVRLIFVEQPLCGGGANVVVAPIHLRIFFFVLRVSNAVGQWRTIIIIVIIVIVIGCR